MKFFGIFVCFSAGCLLAQTPAAPAGALPLGPAIPVAPATAVPPDKVVISVGDVKITAEEFNQIIDALPEQYRATARGPGKKDFGQNLLRVFLLAQEGKNRKIDQTPEFKAQEQFQAANLLAQKTFSQIALNIKVDDAQLRAFYDAHKQDYEQVRARHILIRASGSPSPAEPGKKELTDAEALAKAQEIRKKLADGADFAQLASTESDDTGSKTRGGDLNFFRHGQMVPPFEQAAFSMKVGEISEPVKSQFGYHIIKVEARKTFEDSKPEIERRVRQEEGQKILDEMQKKANATLDPEFFGTSVPAAK
ncbi:MAG: peptidylprolyl isomerase [Acidobacteriia bacterium]|nr:peptidylprolyl isomerase [Terriglobia bacterium]MBV8907017.1 peptidylprolyl isomerase [Terriglobia bacterium]